MSVNNWIAKLKNRHVAKMTRSVLFTFFCSLSELFEMAKNKGVCDAQKEKFFARNFSRMSYSKNSSSQSVSSSSSSSKDKANNKSVASTSGNKRPQLNEDDEYLRKKHKFIRSTVRTDYQPDVCKDYKNTGFCGFGDSCKFLHDRSDYKHGWQIEQEWKKGEYREEDDEKYLIENSDEDNDDEDDANKCTICKQEYKDPVITKCKHIFCSGCADKECVTKCFTCDKPTSGIFKNASKLIKTQQGNK